MNRRNFIKGMLGGTALSVVALSELNAEIYKNLKTLNLKYLDQQSPDGVYWDAVRKHYMMENGLIMMNNGTVGPIPKPVLNTFNKWVKVQATNPYDVYSYLPRKTEEVRVKLAQYMGASPDEVAITRNTTEGMNLVASGLDLKPGDEVIMTNLEHSGGYNPWRLKEKRYGINIVQFPIGVPPKDVDEIVESFKKVITPRSKVLLVSHTVYITGLIAPLKELSEEAHKRGILVVADSAHGLGMLDLNMHEYGVDFWASSPYKWFGALPNRGVFYVKKESQERLWPTIVSGGWESDTARKYDRFGQRLDALTLALGESVEFSNIIGKSRIARRIQTMGSYLRKELKTIPGVRVHTSEDEYLSAGLTAFSIRGVDAGYMVNYVREKYNIVIRTIGRENQGTRGVRVSTNIFVTMKDIDTLLKGVRYLAGKA